jgi:hypothetical protein
MFLAGVPVPDRLVLELARLVDDEDLETKLRGAHGREIKVLALETDERETILTTLVDPPAGLEELRAVLLQEHVWRIREGLAERGGSRFAKNRPPWHPRWQVARK